MKSGAQQMTDLTSEMEQRVLVEHVTCDRQGRSQPRISGGTPASGRWARGGCEQMSPLQLRGSGVAINPRIFCSFLIQNPAFCMHSLVSKMGTTCVFLKTPMHWGNENCWKRLLNETGRAEN